MVEINYPRIEIIEKIDEEKVKKIREKRKKCHIKKPVK
jgi:hypothetical protein